MARRRFQIDDDVPVATNQIIDPVVVRHDDVAALRVAARRDQGRAGGRRRLMQFGIVKARLRERRHVVPCQFDPTVHRQHVVRVNAYAARIRAARDALYLSLILVADLVPEHLVRRVAIKRPVVRRDVLQVFFEDA